jgi:pimeloyl-ACP methyl ester carboxylesterase
MIPVPTARLDVPTDDGCLLRLRRYGHHSGPRLLITHGNGFAVDGYLPFWRDFLPGFDVVVFDFRNHGRSDRSDPVRHVYAQLARDLARVRAAVDDELGRKPTAGIFHSMSARTAMKHAIELGWTWDAMVLFDPPNVPPVDHPVYETMRVFEGKLVDYAGGRKRHFETVAELADDYRGARGTKNWVSEAVPLMAEAVLREEPDGTGWSLVCAPEIEAAIYAEAMTLNLWPPATAFDGPVKLIGADPDSKYAPATAFANQALGLENGYDYASVPGTGHLLQIEQPIACARIVSEFLAGVGLRAATR